MALLVKVDRLVDCDTDTKDDNDAVSLPALCRRVALDGPAQMSIHITFKKHARHGRKAYHATWASRERMHGCHKPLPQRGLLAEEGYISECPRMFITRDT